LSQRFCAGTPLALVPRCSQTPPRSGIAGVPRASRPRPCRAPARALRLPRAQRPSFCSCIAPHTPRPGRKANSWFCLPRIPRCHRRVARSRGHAVGYGHAACLTPAHACTPNMNARPCLALAVVHCRTLALPNASRTRVNHSGCEPCPWPCSLPNRCPEIPFTLPCSFFSSVVHRTPSR